MPDENEITTFFGSPGNIFYAGPSGAGFQIKTEARFGNYRQLLANNSAGILVGDFILVSYGDQVHPSNPSAANGLSYLQNKEIDAWTGSGTDPALIDTEHDYGNALTSPGYYNATLWQKTISGYDLMFGCASAAPDISFSTSDNLIAPGAIDDAQMIVRDNETSTADNQKFIFTPIAPWNLSAGTAIDIGAGELPQVVVNNNASDASINATDQSTDTKYIHFGIPRAWNIENNVIVTSVSPNEIPNAILQNSEISGHESTHKQLSLDIPIPWDLTVNAIPISSMEDPDAEITSPDDISLLNTHKQINLRLPKAWDFATPTVQVIGSMETPQVSIASGTGDDDSKKIFTFSLPASIQYQPEINLIGETEQASIVQEWVNPSETPLRTRRLIFSLPRGTKIYCGTLLDEAGRQEASQTTTSSNAFFSTLKIGDLYISTKSGTIWKLNSITENTYNFVSQGVMALPKPSITIEKVSPYTQNLQGTSTYDNINGWNLNLEVPRAPTLESNLKLVPSNYTGEIGITNTQTENGLVISGNIPKGVQIFTGDYGIINTISHSTGDYFLANNDFTLYRYTDNGYDIIGNLHGKPFQIIGNSIPLTPENLQNYSSDTVSGKIKQYLEENAVPNGLITPPEERREFLSVIYTTPEDSVTYWAYRFSSSYSYEVIKVSATSGSSILISETPVGKTSIEGGSELTFNANGILALQSDLNTKIDTTNANISAISSNITNGGTKVYEITLQSGAWSNGAQSKQIANLKCGSEGNTPPMILYKSGTIADYRKIINAEAFPKSGNTNGHIDFTLATGSTVSGNLVLTVIDFG